MGRIPRRRRRWVVALAVAAAVCTGLWLWVESLGHVDPDLTLAARGQVVTDSGVSHPDFNGDWQLDLPASESLTPIMRAKGKSDFECKVLAKIPSTHVIRGDYRRMTVAIKTPLGSRAGEVVTDGKPAKVLDPEGKEVVAVTRWSDDGQSLITTTPEDAGGRPAQMVMTRSLDPDRRTMYLDFEYRLPGADPIKVRRVLRLVAVPEGPAQR
jgi:hypothetical protein